MKLFKCRVCPLVHECSIRHVVLRQTKHCPPDEQSTPAKPVLTDHHVIISYQIYRYYLYWIWSIKSNQKLSDRKCTITDQASNLSKAHETHDSLAVPQPLIAKNTKTTYYGGSWSFKIIDVDTIKSLSLLLVMISSMSVSICNHFHATQANSTKITTF